MNTITIIHYSTSTGKEPFRDWLNKIDPNVRAIIRTRLIRVRMGNFGDCKQIKGVKGLWELRIDHGAGYRIYYGKKGGTMVVVLLGGDKASQDRDIKKAHRYWCDYEESQ
jgi:putative addiction module killer protein